jgi:hypothetical protein
MSEKTCKKCNQKKQYSSFTKDKRRVGGVTSICKECSNVYSREKSRKPENVEKRKKYYNSPEKKIKTTEYYKQPRVKELKKKYSKNPNTIQAKKNWRYKKMFGITQEDYNFILSNQNGVCAICNNVDGSGKALAVDHCHKSGKNRGLLCSNCNIALGLLKDDKVLFINAIRYLKIYGN